MLFHPICTRLYASCTPFTTGHVQYVQDVQVSPQHVQYVLCTCHMCICYVYLLYAFVTRAICAICAVCHMYLSYITCKMSYVYVICSFVICVFDICVCIICICYTSYLYMCNMSCVYLLYMYLLYVFVISAICAICHVCLSEVMCKMSFVNVICGHVQDVIGACQRPDWGVYSKRGRQVCIASTYLLVNFRKESL